MKNFFGLTFLLKVDTIELHLPKPVFCGSQYSFCDEVKSTQEAKRDIAPTNASPGWPPEGAGREAPPPLFQQADWPDGQAGSGRGLFRLVTALAHTCRGNAVEGLRKVFGTFKWPISPYPLLILTHISDIHV